MWLHKRANMPGIQMAIFVGRLVAAWQWCCLASNIGFQILGKFQSLPANVASSMFSRSARPSSAVCLQDMDGVWPPWGVTVTTGNSGHYALKQKEVGDLRAIKILRQLFCLGLSQTS